MSKGKVHNEEVKMVVIGPPIGTVFQKLTVLGGKLFKGNCVITNGVGSEWGGFVPSYVT